MLRMEKEATNKIKLFKMNTYTKRNNLFPFHPSDLPLNVIVPKSHKLASHNSGSVGVLVLGYLS